MHMYYTIVYVVYAVVRQFVTTAHVFFSTKPRETAYLSAKNGPASFKASDIFPKLPTLFSSIAY